MYAAILAGGVGTRLWPRSRQAHPKQFADITGAGRTMIQATVDRLDGLIATEHVWVVTGAAYAALAARQLPTVDPAHILAEPNGRNTAPAIGLACIYLQRQDPQAVLAVLPADHVIANRAAFQQALACAESAAQAGNLVTLGIEPTFAHTGYGYIQRGALLTPAAPGALPVHAVNCFLEKPDRETAEGFLRTGGYYWNGGIFVFRVDVMLAEMRRQQPELYAHLQAIGDALERTDADFDAALAEQWAQMPALSIDVGIMEHAARVAMVPLHAGWNDVGSWDALENVLQRDRHDNFVAHANAHTLDSYGNIVFSEKRIVALIGVDDLVVVEDGDALLIGHKHQMQRVRDVVEELRARGHADLV